MRMKSGIPKSLKMLKGCVSFCFVFHGRDDSDDHEEEDELEDDGEDEGYHRCRLCVVDLLLPFFFFFFFFFFFLLLSPRLSLSPHLLWSRFLASRFGQSWSQWPTSPQCAQRVLD